MICKKCNSEIPDTAKFCPKCGSKIEVLEKTNEKEITEKNVCPKCGAIYPITAKFCKIDGTPLQKFSPSVSKIEEFKIKEEKAELIEEKPSKSAKEVIYEGIEKRSEPKMTYQLKKEVNVMEELRKPKSSKKWIWITICLLILIIAGGIGGYLYFTGKIFKKPQEISVTQPVSPSAPSVPSATVPPSQPQQGVPPFIAFEVKEHIKHGLAYVNAAKNARNKAIFEENIENAIKEFSLAIEKDPNSAEAYSNRGVAYMVQKKFNKALEDLKKAKELNPDDPSIRYNLACLYSLTNNIDLALDEIDAALEKGFNDYDALRNDPDLSKLRKHPEFKKILEKHKVFILK